MLLYIILKKMTDSDSKMLFLKNYDLHYGIMDQTPVVEKNYDMTICVGVIFFIILII